MVKKDLIYFASQKHWIHPNNMTTSKNDFTKTTIPTIQLPLQTLGSKRGVYDIYYNINKKGMILLVSQRGTKTFYL
jgi:hypothetical protein